MTFARESWPFVAPPAGAAVVLVLFGQAGWALVATLLALALLLFFRVPTRRSAAAPQIVLAPANGVVTRVDRVSDGALGDGSFHRIVTFLSVFDVHVQRAPASGRVEISRYAPGRKIAAFRPHADEVNESHLTVIRTPGGDLIAMRQIAGLLARRVVGYCRTGERVARGDLVGLIKFGSRVDLLVPESYRLEVAPGQRLREGETPVARPGEDA